MIFSSKAEYGVRLMVELGRQTPDQPTSLKAIADEDSQFYHVIQDILVAHLHGNAAQVSVEIGRGSVPGEYQPSFQEVEAAISAIPPDSA